MRATTDLKTSKPNPALPLSGWQHLTGAALTRQFTASFGKRRFSADSLRTLIVDFNMLGMKMSDPALLKWLTAHVQTAMKAASVDDMVSLLKQAVASQIPVSTVNKWVPDGWGKMQSTRPQSPYWHNAADLAGWEQRLTQAFPKAKVVVAPRLESGLALRSFGEPIRLTVKGDEATLASGEHVVSARIAHQASPAQLDELLTRLVTRLGA